MSDTTRYYVTEPDQKMSVAEVDAMIRSRLDESTVMVAELRQKFLIEVGESGYALLITDRLRRNAQHLAFIETFLCLYQCWVNHDPQTAVDKAMHWVGCDSRSPSPWIAAVENTQREAAMSWLRRNTIEIQSVDISWPDAIAQL